MPTVFISAASVDLEPLRDVLHTAWSRAGFEVKTQGNSLPSAPGNVHRLLSETIKKCDCVLHLAGLGYGSDATEPFPDFPEFECSWTQFEYYFAHKLGKDVIAFVTAPNLSVPDFEEKGDDDERSRKGALQQAHRSRVASGKFEGTPLEGITGRTSNEIIDGEHSLLQAVAAAVGTLKNKGAEWVNLQSELEALRAEREGLQLELEAEQVKREAQRRWNKVLWVGIVAAAITLGAIFFASRKDSWIESLIRRGVETRMDNGEDEEAYDYFDGELDRLLEIGEKRETSIELIFEMATKALEAGETERAERYFEAIRSARRRLPEANLAYHRYLVFDKGTELETWGEFDQARAVYLKSKEVVSEIGSDRDQEIAARAWRAQGISRERIGDAYMASGINPMVYYIEAHQETQKRASEQPNDLQLQRELAVDLDRLGDVALQQGKFTNSKKHYTKALQIRKRPEVQNFSAASDLDLFVSYIKLGDVAMAVDDIAEARSEYTKASDLAEGRSEPAWIENRGVGHEKLGRVAAAEEDHSKAKELLNKALSEFRSLLTEDESEFSTREKVVNIQISLGRSAEGTGDLLSAGNYYKEAVNSAQELGRPRGQQLYQIALNNLCWIRILENKSAEAVVLADEGVALIESLAYLPGSASVKMNLATAHLFNGNYEKAVTLYDETFKENPRLRDSFRDDLETFGERGLDHPDLDRVRERFDFH